MSYDPHNTAVIELGASKHARLRPAPLARVDINDGFWLPWMQRNREKTLPDQYRSLVETGRLDNLRFAATGEGRFKGIYFNDSDVFKWLEGACWSLISQRDTSLECLVAEAADVIEAAQQPDGYLNSYYSGEKAGERFTNLRDMHEIYCAGHLFQAAVAHHRATGEPSLLNVARRYADLLDREFGPNGRVGACGHPEAEMALVELARETGETRYLALAERFIEARGAEPRVFDNRSYLQDHVRFAEAQDVAGHAVRQLYLCSGGADVALENGREEYRAALERLWQNFTERRMYITGGAGARYEGEAFGADWELPNDRAYAETCAAIASVQWNFRMLHLTGESRFADLMEETLFNAVLPGISLTGDTYFYENPLSDRGAHRRQPWFDCACCPPNVARMIASLPGYVASTEAAAGAAPCVQINLYTNCDIRVELADVGEVHLRIETQWPWEGAVTATVIRCPEDARFGITLRVPQWADGATISGAAGEQEVTAGTFVRTVHAWSAGDRLELQVPFRPVRVRSHPFVLSNHGRTAVICGPLIYCAEQVDLPDQDVWDVAIPADAPLYRQGFSGLPGQANAVHTEGVKLTHGPSLYAMRPPAPGHERFPLTLVPYFMWANRAAGPMQVWLPET
ncbi:MAG: glycoside hydrolase family 127 protein [Armatimonadetes bacterium]|nr:glycoside hydrolase family 127 protein [Armatimonadota bacterium]MDE2205805.1 glycoside hydrolase family 127 protein [Armatimonadota bacterium]